MQLHIAMAGSVAPRWYSYNRTGAERYRGREDLRQTGLYAKRDDSASAAAAAAVKAGFGGPVI